MFLTVMLLISKLQLKFHANFSAIFKFPHAYRRTDIAILRGGRQGFARAQDHKTHLLAAAPHCPERFPCRFGRSTDTCRDPTWTPLICVVLVETADESGNLRASRLRIWAAPARRFVATARTRSGTPKQSS
jgi:hypothetical protein